MIRLYKDGDSMGITTDVADERTFIQDISDLFGTMIEDKRHDHDWSFQLAIWLDQIVDICCAYRGYQNEVSKRTLYAAGRVSADIPLDAMYENHATSYPKGESDEE